jgi:hypothetical protein
MVIQNKMCGMLTSSVIQLHAAHSQELLLGHFNWELFDHLPYSTDLALSHYLLFIYLNNRL